MPILHLRKNWNKINLLGNSWCRCTDWAISARYEMRNKKQNELYNIRNNFQAKTHLSNRVAHRNASKFYPNWGTVNEF